MSSSWHGPVRIWEGEPKMAEGAAGPADGPVEALARSLIELELLRSPRPPELPEPLSLPWFLELETQRYSRQGRWLPRLLEFSRHAGDRVLGLGGALGTDWARYAADGADVVAACPFADQLAIFRRNFEARGLHGTFLHASATDLPLAGASIDVVVFTGLLHEMEDPTGLIDEAYRVLKPGGKLLAVAPAYYDGDYWGRWSIFGPGRWVRPATGPRASCGLLAPEARRFSRRELLQLFARFSEPRVHKRHLRRGDAPHLWRWLPLSLLQRWMGRLLIYKGFKPLSAALPAVAVAA